jgi:hypothetical protein
MLKYLLAFIPSLSLATGTPPPKPATQTQGQSQGQEQHQTANSVANAASTASAQGGTGGNANSQASNAGNSQTVVTERSAPALGQGSFAISGCGVGGNVGNSSSGGAQFLGFGFTPEQCYDFKLAEGYAALGAYAAACEVLNMSKAGQRAKKRGVTLPVCNAPVVPVVSQPPPPVVVNVEPAPVPSCAKALKQCVRK